MTKKICFKFAFALLVVAGIVSFAVSRSWAQAPAEKTTKEQSTAPKNTAEKTAKEQDTTSKSQTDASGSDSTINFPQLEGAVELHPARGTRITLKATASSRDVYESIGKLAKISVLFDPDYTPRTITVDLNGVTLHEALKIVAFESRTFWRPVTSEAIFVAQDTQSKHRELEQQIIKTFYFPNISAPTEMQDIVNAIRTIIDVQRIQMLPFSQSIVVRATPEQVVLMERIVDDLNRAKQKTGGQYRLEFKITDSNDEKKAGSRTYTVLIEPRSGTGKIRVGSKMPIQTSEKEKTYTDIGKSIDCQIRAETEHTLSLRLAVEVSGVNSDEHGAAEFSNGNPVIQRVNVETNVTLELGTPTIVSSFQDPMSKHNFQIEATATRTKSKD